MNIKKVLKKYVPFSTLTAWRSMKARWSQKQLARKDIRDVFMNINKNNAWGSVASVSGPGSEDHETEEIRALLPDLIRRWRIKLLLDAPCGDFAWMRLVDLGECRYIGADIVEPLIVANRATHAGQNREFIYANLTRDSLPRADLILCRDCLIHLSFKDAKAVLANFRASGSTYLLATTNPTVEENTPIITGGFRNLNLCLQPFNLPAPIELHRDRYHSPKDKPMIDPHKSLGLWKLADMKL
jgi:hypothetical protein